MSSPQRPHTGWQASLVASPLIAWRSAQLSLLSDVLRSALVEWAAEWGLPDGWDAEVGCASAQASGGAAQSWSCLGRSGEGHTWISAAPREQDQLAEALFPGAGAPTELLLEIVEACRCDVTARLASALLLEQAAGGPRAIPSSLFAPWSGAVLASLPWGGRMLLEGVVVERLLRSRGEGSSPARRRVSPVVPLAQAMASLAVPVQVRLEACDVAIGSLQDLQPGDVLRLRHRLDAPAAVTAGHGEALFTGFLARSRGRKAIELAPAGVR
jgi:hypothetical protein